VTYNLRGWGRESNIKLPHIVSNVIAKYKLVVSGVKVIKYFFKIGFTFSNTLAMIFHGNLLKYFIIGSLAFIGL